MQETYGSFPRITSECPSGYCTPSDCSPSVSRHRRSGVPRRLEGIETNCSPPLPLERRLHQARFHQALWMEGPPGRTVGAAMVGKSTLLTHGGHPKCRFGRWYIFAATPPTNFYPLGPVHPSSAALRHLTVYVPPLPRYSPPFRYDRQRSVRRNIVRGCIREPTASGLNILTWDRSKGCMRLIYPCNRATRIPLCAVPDQDACVSC